MNKVLSILILGLILFESCDSGGANAIECPSETYDCGCASGNIYDVEINASAYNKWIYFSFETGNTLEINNPESSLDWDIAFKKNHIRTNGGLSGIGQGCGAIDQAQYWTCELFESTYEIPDDIVCESDIMIEGSGLLPLFLPYEGCYCPEFECSDCLDNSDIDTVCEENYAPHYWLDCVKNPSLDMWGSFDQNRDFNITENMMFIKDAQGNDFKIWLQAYDYDDSEPLIPDDNGEFPSTTGYIEMKYQILDF